MAPQKALPGGTISSSGHDRIDNESVQGIGCCSGAMQTHVAWRLTPAPSGRASAESEPVQCDQASVHRRSSALSTRQKVWCSRPSRLTGLAR